MSLISILKESINLSSKTIINVDIQPEYANSFSFQYEWAEWLNEQSDNNTLVFLYNGKETLDMVSEQEYIYWLFDQGVEESVLKQAVFYDKGYAFFRYCMDEGIKGERVADLVRFMMEREEYDSRDLDEEFWMDFIETYGHENIKELLEHSGDMISIPDLMFFLKNYNNIYLTGGGIDECLKEVEIALMALNKPYNIIDEYTY